MRRVYFLAPDVNSAHKTVDDLLARGVDDRHIHLVASSDTDLGTLPEADALENSDLFPARTGSVPPKAIRASRP